MRVRIACLIAIHVGLGGCNPFWPPHGGGGMAETHPPPTTNEGAAASTQLDGLVEELEALRKAGANVRFPGQVAEAEGLVVRIRRAIGGGLIQDAEKDVAALRGEISSLSQRLQSRIEA